MTITAEVLARVAIAVAAEVVESGAIWNNATATTIIAAEVAAFASDPRYAEHRDNLDVFYEEQCDDLAEGMTWHGGGY